MAGLVLAVSSSNVGRRWTVASTEMQDNDDHLHQLRVDDGSDEDEPNRVVLGDSTIKTEDQARKKRLSRWFATVA